IDPFRSHRFLSAPDRHPVSGQVTIEQHITVELMCAHWWLHRLLEAIDRAECKTWPTGTEDQWCNHQMQTIKAAGLNKTRQGGRAAFDQHAAQAKFGESSKDYRRRNISVC